MGYRKQEQYIQIEQNQTLDIYLEPVLQSLSEVSVSPQKSLIDEPLHKRLSIQKIHRKPSFLGADDALMRLQQLPGTGNAITGFSNLQVRGGDSHENLVLLDGVPIYNYNHFPGLLSIFNSQALKSIDFYKGLFPARYAGRLSSVTDIRMREGDIENYHIGGNINLATLSMFVEGPIIKHKASFMLSGRRSWIDALSSWGNADEQLAFHLHDINMKLNYQPSRNNRLYVSAYQGADSFGSSSNDNGESETLQWSNQLASIRWNHLFNDRLFCNSMLYFSHFENSATSFNDSISSQKNKNIYSLQEIKLQSDIEYFAKAYQLRVGTAIQGNIFDLPISQFDNKRTQRINTWQWKSYVENKLQISTHLQANIGLNYVLYQNDNRSFNYFQPRIHISYQSSESSVLAIGFSEMQQYILQIGSHHISLPFAFRLPASAACPPSWSRLYELKYSQLVRKAQDKLSVSAYIKQQANILRYRAGQSVFDHQLAADWHKQVLRGERQVVGLELAYEAKLSTLRLFFSYALTENKERFPGINFNSFYLNANTPNHILTLNADYAFNAQHSISLATCFNSGLYISLPLYQVSDIQNINKYNYAADVYVQSQENAYQLPNNFHLDIGYTYSTSTNKRSRHILQMGVYNVLGSSAPFRVTAEVYKQAIEIESVHLPSPMPYFSYSFKF